MDENQFDERIKSKVGEFEDPSFDPSALAALHYQLGAISPWPWYAQYRTELLVGAGLIASTLIILWSQWLMNFNSAEAQNEKMFILQNQQAEINKLLHEVSELKKSPPDTIRIIEIWQQPTSYYTSLLDRVKWLETELAESERVKNDRIAKFEDSWEDGNGTLHETVFPIGEEATPESGWYSNPISLRLSPRRTERKGLHAETDKEQTVEQGASQHLSVKTLRELEKHYQKGIGIRVGPTIEISKGFYQQGSGRLDVTAGMLADFILSPSLSLETGVKYVHRVYNISDKSNLTAMEWPGSDESLGTLKKVDIDSWIFEIPVNLKYRYPLSINTHWLAGIGYSSVIYGSQLFDYEYSMDSNPSATINSDYKEKHAQLYPGLLNFSLGLSNRLKNKKILETSIYYQLGLGEAGIDNNRPMFFGVRGVYWFTVR